MNLFEFNDLPRIPQAFRQTLLEVMELCNRNFRSFNEWAAHDALEYARRKHCDTIVELGAGSAPITKVLAGTSEAGGMNLVPCDLFPEVDSYRELEQRHPDTVKPVYTPVDFSEPHDFGPSSLAVLVGTFHHVPSEIRSKTLQSLTKSVKHVLVFEPIRNTPVSILFSLTAIVPVLLLPLLRLGSPGTLRRILWCWLLPVVPFMFLWDAVVSCLREWSPKRWRRELGNVVDRGRPVEIRAWVHATAVAW